MKDFNLDNFFFLEILFCLILFMAYYLHIRLLQHLKLKAHQSLKKFKHKDIPFYYSSFAVKQEYTRKFFKLAPKPESIIYRMASKNLNFVLKIFPQLKNKYRNRFLPLLEAQLLSITHLDNFRFQFLMENYQLPSFSPLHYQALYYYLSAKQELFNTDMNNASFHCSKALNLYKKIGFQYEQAECYLLLAQIYRISGIKDIAFTMLKKADKIFNTLKMAAKSAETTAYFGLIEMQNENLTPAIEHLTKALNIAKQNKLTQTIADIYNWLGLTYFLNNELEKAKNYFTHAYKHTHTNEGKNYAAEMLARIYFKQSQYDKALKYVNTAISLATHNLTNKLENLYLKAEILYEQNNFDKASQLLTSLIRQKLPPNTAFYQANAYTLLGLIKLNEQNLAQAKNLFKQALDLEHGKNRLKGAAIDYNNLSVIARLEGNIEQATTYLTKALQYATEIEDAELKTYIEAKLANKRA